MQITQAAMSAFGNFNNLAVAGKVGNELLGCQILDDGADRYA